MPKFPWWCRSLLIIVVCSLLIVGVIYCILHCTALLANRNLNEWRVFVGYLIACLIGGWISTVIIESVWLGQLAYAKREAEKAKKSKEIKEIEQDINDRKYPLHTAFRFVDGVLEKAIYTTCFIFDVPKGVAVWLVFKGLITWNLGTARPRWFPGPGMFLFGTALALFFSFLGALIATKGNLTWIGP